MKTIIITRHAKSSWDDILQTDFDRTLNERGIRDAPMMGRRLKNKNIKVDKIISSAAIRAAQTARHIATTINYEESQITFLQDLYHAQPTMINDVIGTLYDTINTAIIVCHNPGITYWANEQIGNLINNMPTCGMMAFQANCTHWQEWEQAKKEFLFFDFPKNSLS